jgi:hypothetical protein
MIFNIYGANSYSLQPLKNHCCLMPYIHPGFQNRCSFFFLAAEGRGGVSSGKKLNSRREGRVKHWQELEL